MLTKVITLASSFLNLVLDISTAPIDTDNPFNY